MKDDKKKSNGNLSFSVISWGKQGRKCCFIMNQKDNFLLFFSVSS